jgi:hypothetical protein
MVRIAVSFNVECWEALAVRTSLIIVPTVVLALDPALIRHLSARISIGKTVFYLFG